ncbi:Flagellar protein G [Candidatus Nanobsidianus stetteri]|uniref:Flagellar protein G n=1 Tax=Nanobsidianus stetteri TaxID=1294122 RepID=R1FT51_NANST|nr:Flagellar protein G [Candidatus Nanobsidianus stetteri]
MKIKAVSPLIATIILIALTVALGAIIVGWAKGYVSNQVSNLGAQVEILQVNYNNSNGNISILVQNIGSTQLITNNLLVEFSSTNGKSQKCPLVLSGNAQGYLACYVYNITDPSSGNSYINGTIPQNSLFLINMTVNMNSFGITSLSGSTIYVYYYDNPISTGYTLS